MYIQLHISYTNCRDVNRRCASPRSISSCLANHSTCEFSSTESINYRNGKNPTSNYCRRALDVVRRLRLCRAGSLRPFRARYIRVLHLFNRHISASCLPARATDPTIFGSACDFRIRRRIKSRDLNHLEQPIQWRRGRHEPTSHHRSTQG